MKICCGTDIIEIERIKKSIEDEKIGRAFVERVYTKKEIEYCESKKAQKYQHYAARFAAKEAAFKALSGQLKEVDSISWRDFEVVNDPQGRPKLNLKHLYRKEIEDIDLSLSHCKEYAVANVVAIGSGFVWQQTEKNNN